MSEQSRDVCWNWDPIHDFTTKLPPTDWILVVWCLNRLLLRVSKPLRWKRQHFENAFMDKNTTWKLRQGHENLQELSETCKRKLPLAFPISLLPLPWTSGPSLYLCFVPYPEPEGFPLQPSCPCPSLTALFLALWPVPQMELRLHLGTLSTWAE